MNKITKQALQENMRVKLQAFNDEKVTIADTTVHNEVLSITDGINRRPPSADLYMWGILWTIDRNGGTNIEWPENWLDLSVSELADYIISKQIY